MIGLAADGRITRSLDIDGPMDNITSLQTRTASRHGR